MSAPLTPPRWAEWLLERALPPGLAREGVLGDLAEELALRAEKDSPGRARRWYAGQALGIAARLGLRRALAATRRDAPLPLDFGHALRSLRHAPFFVLLTSLTLALGVGATTAIFSVVDGVLLRPLPYEEPGRLVVSKLVIEGEDSDNHSEPEVLDLMATREVFEAVAAYRVSQPLLGAGPEPERVACLLASASFFQVLGVDPLLGRVYTTDEDDAVTPERVAVLSHGLWVRAFGADPEIVGKSVLFENTPHTVVGVMPEGFSFPTPGIEVWRPLRIDRQEPVARNNHYLRVIGRLAEGVTPARAAAPLSALGARSTSAHPEFYPERMSYRVVPMQEDLVGDVRSPLLLLMAAVALVLLIAVVNAASLFLARDEGRRGELAVRTALGAPRGRIAGQLLAESLVVAMVAGALGVGLAYGGVAALRRLAPANLPRLEHVAVDGRILLFALAVALATGVVFGLAPAAQAWKSDVRDVLAGGGRGGIGGRRTGRFRRGLVVTQLALAALLSVGAGLLVRSFAELRATDLGFRPEGVLVVPLSPLVSTVAPDADAVTFYRTLEARIAALSGVTAVGSGLRIPLTTGHDNYSVQIEGREVATIGESPAPGMEWVTPGYFEALGITLLAGRLFTASDDAGARPVAVVGAKTARELWPGEDPLGKRLRMFNPASPWMEVIGVVEDVRHYGVRAEPSAMLYIPHLQGFVSGYYSPNAMNLFVRSGGDPLAPAAAVREGVRELEPRMPIGAVRAMDDVVEATLSADRFTLLVLAGFATGALLLAIVGVYGVVAATVARRTREIGLRMAVGAGRSRILIHVLNEGLLLAAWGAALGLGGALLLARFLGSVLYEVTPADPWAYVAAGPALIGAVALATLVPALRAARLDPVDALRSE